MKILLFDNSGLIIKNNDFCVETNTGNFAKELKDLDNEITFFGQKIESTPNTVHEFEVLKNGMFVKGGRKIKFKTLNYILLYLRSIPAIYNSDFVYIFYPNAFKYVAFIATILRVKYGLYIRGMEGLDNKSSHWIYRHAFTVFTVSDKFSSYVNGITGQNISKSIRPMIPFTDKDIQTKRIYTINGKYNLLYLGRTSDDKGLIELLHAISALLSVRSDFHLTIVGTGEYIDELKKITTSLRITEFVTFAGGVYDLGAIKEYYINSDLFVLPSYHEGFPRTLYEAMIFGTPILTTFVGGISQHMRNNGNCLELKVKSSESIVRSLDFAMNNYNHMIGLAKNGMKTVSKIVDARRLTHAEMLITKLESK